MVIIDENGRVIKELSRTLGIRTNNQAEYAALLCGLQEAHLLARQPITIQTDSELLHRQLLGRYRVKNEQLKPLHARAADLLASLPQVSLVHVPREQNRRADRLAQAASLAASEKRHASED